MCWLSGLFVQLGSIRSMRGSTTVPRMLSRCSLIKSVPSGLSPFILTATASRPTIRSRSLADNERRREAPHPEPVSRLPRPSPLPPPPLVDPLPPTFGWLIAEDAWISQGDVVEFWQQRLRRRNMRILDWTIAT